MTPTETRHFRILASYSSAIDYPSAPISDSGLGKDRGKIEGRWSKEKDIPSHLIYELSTLHLSLPESQTPHSPVISVLALLNPNPPSAKLPAKQPAYSLISFVPIMTVPVPLPSCPSSCQSTIHLLYSGRSRMNRRLRRILMRSLLLVRLGRSMRMI